MPEPIDQLRRYGESLAGSVPAARSRLAALRAVGADPEPVRRAPRVAVAAVGFFAIANVAAAAISDGAAPGDLLYPLDRAYEKVGQVLGIDDHAEERLTEADVLVRRADLGGALDLVAEVTPEPAVKEISTDLADQAQPDEVESLVATARALGEAARAGDRQTMAETIAAIRLLAAQLADRAASGHPATPADPGGPDGPATPAQPDPPNRPDDPGSQGRSQNPGNRGGGRP